MIVLLALSLAAAAPDTAGPLLTSAEARRIGLEANLAMRGNRLQTEIASHQTRASLGGLLPTVNFTSTASRVGPNFAGDVHTGNPVTSGYGIDDQWSAAVSAQWTFLNPGTWYQWHANEAQERSSKAHVSGQEQQLAFAIDQAYYDVVRQQALLSAQLDALAVSQRRRDIARVHREVGTGSLLELRQAQLTANADSSALLSQEATLALSRRSLNVLLARSAEAIYRVTDSIPVADPGDSATLWSEVLRRSPGIAELDARLEAYRAQVHANAASTYLPTLSAFSNYGFLNRWNDPSTSNAHWQGFAFGLTLTMPIYAGGSPNAQLDVARATLRQTELVREDSIQQLRKSFSQAWTVWKQAKAVMNLEESNLVLADSTLATGLGQYAAGTVSGIDLRTTQELNQQARARRITARYAARTASQQLLLITSRELAP